MESTKAFLEVSKIEPNFTNLNNKDYKLDDSYEGNFYSSEMSNLQIFIVLNYL